MEHPTPGFVMALDVAPVESGALPTMGPESPAGMLWSQVSQNQHEASGCPGAGHEEQPVLQGKSTSLSFHPWVLMKGSAYARPRNKCPGWGWGDLVGQGRRGLISVLSGILKLVRETRPTPQLGNQLRQDVTFSAL